jgi:hypothetical protein
MTELSRFLTSVYDAFSEAEMQALQHGQTRLAELLESGTVPEDVTVPVYHASDVQVSLDVGLVAEETEEGMEVFVTEAEGEDASELDFTVDLFDLLEKEDLEDVGYGDVFPGAGWNPTGEGRSAERRSKHGKDRPGDADDEGDPDRADDAGDDEREGGDSDEVGEDDERRGPPIDVIDDIDARYRARLRDAGVDRLTHLVEWSPEEIAAAVEAEAVTPERAADWRAEARGLASILAEREADLPVELVDGIGPTFGERLRAAGIDGLLDLVERQPETIADRVSTGESAVSADRAATWLERAEATLAAVRASEAGPEGDDGRDTDTSHTTADNDT